MLEYVPLPINRSNKDALLCKINSVIDKIR